MRQQSLQINLKGAPSLYPLSEHYLILPVARLREFEYAVAEPTDQSKGGPFSLPLSEHYLILPVDRLREFEYAAAEPTDQSKGSPFSLPPF